MYEHRSDALLSRGQFARRQAAHIAAAILIIAAALGIGVAGYRGFEHQGWIDSIYSASMILTGMGPAQDVKTDAGKLFASAYAIFSGLIFLSASAVILAPTLHRLLHRLHLDDEDRTDA